MKKVLKLASVSVATLLLAGCFSASSNNYHAKAPEVKPEPVAPAPAPAPAKEYVLSGDFLFDFDKATLTAKGTEVVDNVAAQLKATDAQQVKVEGHTDRLGTDAYNLDLSKRRANTVAARLKQQGVTAEIIPVGLGEAHQVKACRGESGQALRDCLRPNRRVVIFANGGLKQHEAGDVAGPSGPTPLYETPAYNSAN